MSRWPKRADSSATSRLEHRGRVRHASAARLFDDARASDDPVAAMLLTAMPLGLKKQESLAGGTLKPTPWSGSGGSRSTGPVRSRPVGRESGLGSGGGEP